MVEMNLNVSVSRDSDEELHTQIVCKDREQAVILCRALGRGVFFTAFENGVDISVMIANYRTE